jgi:hypothetical protein
MAYTHSTPDEHSEFNPRCAQCRKEAEEAEKVAMTEADALKLGIMVQ